MGKPVSIVFALSVVVLVTVLYLDRASREDAGEGAATPPHTVTGETDAPSSGTPAESTAPSPGLPDDTAAKDGQALLEENRAKAEQVRKEIETLMQAFNNSLDNPEERKRLKQQIDARMAEYNAYVLPVAVDAVKNRP